MGLFDIFNKKKTVSINEMMTKAIQWKNDYITNYSIKTTVNSEKAVFMFCAWAAWDYCLNSDKLPSGDPGTEFLASVQVYTGLDKTMFPDSFIELYKTRFHIFKSDIRGLASSHYPQTKQYIPFALYCVFCKNPLELDPTIGVDQNDMAIFDEVVEFTSKFVTFWNKILRDMNSNF